MCIERLRLYEALINKIRNARIKEQIFVELWSATMQNPESVRRFYLARMSSKYRLQPVSHTVERQHDRQQACRWLTDAGL